MGFSENKGIGKRNNKPTEILILKARPKGLGLGAQNEETKILKQFQSGDWIKINEGNHKGIVGQVL